MRASVYPSRRFARRRVLSSPLLSSPFSAIPFSPYAIINHVSPSLSPAAPRDNQSANYFRGGRLNIAAGLAGGRAGVPPANLRFL